MQAKFPRSFPGSVVRKRAAWWLLILLLVASGCVSRPPEEDFRRAWREWRAARRESVAGEDGWATLAGLHWLREGSQTAGGADTNDIVLTRGRVADFAGTFTRTGSSVHFSAAPDQPAQLDGQPVASTFLRSDAEDDPAVLHLGHLRVLVLARGERIGLRVKDPQARTRTGFRGLDYFTYDPGRRVTARYECYSPPKRIPLADVTGAVLEELSPGALVFTLDGQELRLDVFEDQEAGDLFILFRDRTSGRSTYGSGRYLHAPLPDARGNVTLDFNFAYNPPCAFTSYATCQLPPRQNWLPVAIEAGERRYRDGH